MVAAKYQKLERDDYYHMDAIAKRVYEIFGLQQEEKCDNVQIIKTSIELNYGRVELKKAVGSYRATVHKIDFIQPVYERPLSNIVDPAKTKTEWPCGEYHQTISSRGAASIVDNHWDFSSVYIKFSERTGEELSERIKGERGLTQWPYLKSGLAWGSDNYLINKFYEFHHEKLYLDKVQRIEDSVSKTRNGVKVLNLQPAFV
jgi:hypothetical protein